MTQMLAGPVALVSRAAVGADHIRPLPAWNTSARSSTAPLPITVGATGSPTLRKKAARRTKAASRSAAPWPAACYRIMPLPARTTGRCAPPGSRTRPLDALGRACG